MKKTTLLLGATLIALSGSAQFRTQPLQVLTAPVDQPLLKAGKFLPNVYSKPAEASKTTATAPRWYNHADALGSFEAVDHYDEELMTFNIIWPDSTVRFTEADGSASNTGISWLSYGEVFSPVNNLYNAVSSANRGKMRITNSDAYTLDSIRLRGLYSRTNASANPDTMLVVVVAEKSNAKFATFSYAGDVSANHGIDSFAALLYSTNTFQKLSTQVGYSSGGSTTFMEADTFKIVMNQQTFIDSLADGSHVLTVGMNPKVTVPAGARVSMTATFKPGVPYTANTPISDYNFWAFMSHEMPTRGGYVVYPPGDLNMSYNLFKDSTGSIVNTAKTLSIYQPSITWTAPFRGEVHNVGWLVSCATCVNVGVDQVTTGLNIGRAYPNPANTSITVPVTVTNAAQVSVTIANVLGQVVARQSFAAGAAQTKNAVFSTEALTNGVYLYTVEANGERVTDRIVVAH